MFPSSERFEWESVSPHESQKISEAECWALLSGEDTGRIAFLQDGRLLVFPVNYLVHGKSVYFRTSSQSGLALLPGDLNTSFQVDSHDGERMAGWSVLVSGRANAVRDEALLTTLWGLRAAAPYGGGERNLFVGIEPTEVTGRRVQMG
ncbi:pyridoxamine 5'-phosphate oxidase family protein [Arthrobacter sp. Helios]|uniref:pyridoxamine 5'-phosphate oxidase family protein n=1 Tax=Arthrobacter sp. Helios TaxID=2828862 RepID=UPI00204A9730|nr:pyridoxamine 5'-phosphate oxidase family protein [Arthrobacter sp. Helios]UPO76754.1 pyridoxamine 5'-phosphate oxidase family protein [Arthrobacter sp. Helios]